MGLLNALRSRIDDARDRIGSAVSALVPDSVERALLGDMALPVSVQVERTEIQSQLSKHTSLSNGASLASSDEIVVEEENATDRTSIIRTTDDQRYKIFSEESGNVKITAVLPLDGQSKQPEIGAIGTVYIKDGDETVTYSIVWGADIEDIVQGRDQPVLSSGLIGGLPSNRSTVHNLRDGKRYQLVGDYVKPEFWESRANIYALVDNRDDSQRTDDDKDGGSVYFTNGRGETFSAQIVAGSGVSLTDSPKENVPTEDISALRPVEVPPPSLSRYPVDMVFHPDQGDFRVSVLSFLPQQEPMENLRVIGNDLQVQLFTELLDADPALKAQFEQELKERPITVSIGANSYLSHEEAGGINSRQVFSKHRHVIFGTNIHYSAFENEIREVAADGNTGDALYQTASWFVSQFYEKKIEEGHPTSAQELYVFTLNRWDEVLATYRKDQTFFEFSMSASERRQAAATLNRRLEEMGLSDFPDGKILFDERLQPLLIPTAPGMQAAAL